MEPGVARERSDGERSEDLALARTAGAGDRTARQQVALRLFDVVRNVARYFVRGDADAEDAAQTAMVEILRCVGEYRGEGSLERWARRIAVRTSLGLVERRLREAQVLQFTADRDGADAAGETKADVEFAARRHLACCLDRLKPERRATVVLRLVYGYTLEEIAELTGAPLNTVKDRLRIGRQELRERILKDRVLRELVPPRLP